MTEEKTIRTTGYTRTIRQRDVTFICAECGREVIEMHYPGRTPNYCQMCAPEVLRRQARERQRRRRENLKAKARDIS